jgi:hypothetical protein
MYVLSKFKCKLSFNGHFNLIAGCASQSSLLLNSLDLIIDNLKT